MDGFPATVVTSLNDLMRFKYMVEGGNVLPKHPIYNMLVGRHEAKMRGRGLDYEEARLYVPGDDIRNIDWKVTARTNETYSKVFNEEKERPTFTVLDQSTRMFFGSQVYVKSVTAAHVAALTAFFTLKRGDRFGGIIFNEEGYDYVRPQRSSALAEHFLQLTAERNKALPLRTKIKPGNNLINDILHRTSTLVTHDYVITVITDLFSLNDDSRRLLRTLALHNDVILVHIEDPMDRQLPEGNLVLSNGERQISWNNDNNKWGKKYTAGYDQQLAALQEDFRHYSIPTSIINTVLPVEKQIKEKLGGRLRK